MICAYCQQSIPDGTPCAMIEDKYSAWLLHPACYTKHKAECEAVAQKELQEAQQLERAKLADWNALSSKT